MKNLILATAFAMFGTIAVSAQITPQKTKTDTIKPDTVRNSNMTTGNMNNNSMDKPKTDTAKWNNREATTGDRKMKKKNK
ncbi:MAG: hypothetical protein AB7E26_02120 [Chryseobacterium sp.]